MTLDSSHLLGERPEGRKEEPVVVEQDSYCNAPSLPFPFRSGVGSPLLSSPRGSFELICVIALEKSPPHFSSYEIKVRRRLPWLPFTDQDIALELGEPSLRICNL